MQKVAVVRIIVADHDYDYQIEDTVRQFMTQIMTDDSRLVAYRVEVENITDEQAQEQFSLDNSDQETLGIGQS